MAICSFTKRRWHIIIRKTQWQNLVWNIFMITSKEAKEKLIVGSLVLSTSCVQVLTMTSVGTLLSAFVMIIQGLLSKLFSTSLFWRQVTNNHIRS